MKIGGITSASNFALMETVQSFTAMRQQPLTNLAMPNPALPTQFIV